MGTHLVCAENPQRNTKLGSQQQFRTDPQEMLSLAVSGMPYMGVFLCQIIHNLQHVDIMPCSSLSKEWCWKRGGES